MDFLNQLKGGAGGQQQQQGGEQQGQQQGQQQGGFNLGSTISGLTSGGGNMGDKLNSMAGGGEQGEKNEDYLDKGVDFVQERFMGQGQQSNETAAEQAKDEVISDQIRAQYKGMTGTDFPIKDKDAKYGL